MQAVAAPPPARRGPLGRFDPHHEAAYRRWLAVRIRSLGAMMAAGSLAAWLVIPLAGALWLPSDADNELVPLVSWGINVPLLAGCLVYLWRSASLRWFMPAATAAVTVTALDSLLLLGPALDVEALV